MGVTLERVQNKFACIIGELCGEPKVLSQFAVWLDLRLAEYKSKGSISLECSGCIPEPSWLDGLNVNHATDRLGSLHRASLYSHPSFPRHPANSHGTMNMGNKTADATVKSEPPGDDSFAYLRECAGFNTASCHEDRTNSRQLLHKQPYNIPNATDNDTDSYSSPVPVKRYRHSDSTGGPPTEESSSDIIALPTKDSFDDRVSMPSSSLSRQTAASASGIADGSLTHPLFHPAHHMQGQNSNLSVMDSRQEEMAGRSECQAPTWMSQRSYRPAGSMDRRNYQTAKNVISAATTLERWFAVKGMGDNRRVECIPPAELNGYLTEFFSTVKKRSGQDYNSDTLLSLRSYIDRYLRDKGYPVSITKSEIFSSSQMAFKLRRQELISGSLKGPVHGPLPYQYQLLQNSSHLSKMDLTSSVVEQKQTDISHSGMSQLGQSISLGQSFSPAQATPSSPRSSSSQTNSNTYSQNSSPPQDSLSNHPNSPHQRNLHHLKSSDQNDSCTWPVESKRSSPSEPSSVSLDTPDINVTRTKSSTSSSLTNHGGLPGNDISQASNQGHKPNPPTTQSDSSRSSHSPDVPSSPLDFFSDLPKIPHTDTDKNQ